VIQAEGANALVRTMCETGGKKLISVHAETMETPFASVVRLVEESRTRAGSNGGTVEQVSEVEIALAKAEIGAVASGCEPASAVTLAGLKKLVKRGFGQEE